MRGGTEAVALEETEEEETPEKLSGMRDSTTRGLIVRVWAVEATETEAEPEPGEVDTDTDTETVAGEEAEEAALAVLAAGGSSSLSSVL